MTKTTRRLCLSAAIALLAALSCPGQKTMSIHAKGIPIRAVLDSIRHKTDYRVFCDLALLQNTPKVDLDLHDVSAQEVLDGCFAGLCLTYEVAGLSLIIDHIDHCSGVYRPVTGLVQTVTGLPIAGATISVGGISQQVTLSDGSFCLPVHSLHTIAAVSCIGYLPIGLTLTYKPRPVIIPLRANVPELDKVVVQAYGQTSNRLSPIPVMEVGNREIRESPQRSIPDALAGKVPGLDIRQLNGVPGSAWQLLVRGQRSLSNGNNMLIVVDGVPLVDNDGYMTIIGSGSAQGAMGASLLNSISPDDIASIAVLKDASATAIYGSRGANGVLLITLRSGSRGKMKFHAAISSGMDWVIKPSPLLNTSQYLAMREEAAENDGNVVTSMSVPEAFNWDNSRSANFQRLVMGNTRWREDANLETSGGGSTTLYLLSGSYHREAAVFPGLSYNQRISLFAHVHQQSRNRRLQLDFSAMYHWENNRLPQQDFSLFQYLASDAPAFFTPAGQPQWSYNGLSYLNIPAQEYNSYSGYVQNQFNHLQAVDSILPGLVLRTSLGYYRIGSTERMLNPISGQDPETDPTGSATVIRNSAHSEMIEGIGEYRRKCWKGELDVLAGVNWQEQKAAYSTWSASGYTSDLLLASGGGNPVVSLTENSSVYRYEALFGRLNYVLDGRYIAELSGRRDGSSRFGPGDQFGNFWAVSGAWIFQEEPWFPSWQWLNFGKLWGSIGTTGNDQIGASYTQVYGTTNVPHGYQGQQGLLPATFNYNDLHWELNYNSELGMDLDFAQNKVSLSTVVYRDWTQNQLVQTSLPGQSGLPGVYANLPANVTNQGVEFRLRTVNWHSKQITWESTVTLTVPVNKLASFPGLANTAFANQLVVGKSLSVVKGYQYLGVSVDSGLFQFRDTNHTGMLNTNDYVAGKNLDPIYYGGMQQHFRYKNLDLDVSILFRRQNGYNPYVILYQQNAPGSQAPSMLGNVPVEWLGRWRQPGDHAVLEKLTATTTSVAYERMQDYIGSDVRAIDASFIRVKSIAFSYELTGSWMKRLSLKEGKICLRGENLFTFTRFPVTDPETQNPLGLPPVKTVTVSLEINFWQP